MKIYGKNYPIGITKLECLNSFGIGENSFSADRWYYSLKKVPFWGREVLFIEFDHNGIADYIYIRNIYGRISEKNNSSP